MLQWQQLHSLHAMMQAAWRKCLRPISEPAFPTLTPTTPSEPRPVPPRGRPFFTPFSGQALPPGALSCRRRVNPSAAPTEAWRVARPHGAARFFRYEVCSAFHDTRPARKTPRVIEAGRLSPSQVDTELVGVLPTDAREYPPRCFSECKTQGRHITPRRPFSIEKRRVSGGDAPQVGRSLNDAG